MEIRFHHLIHLDMGGNTPGDKLGLWAQNAVYTDEKIWDLVIVRILCLIYCVLG